MGQEEKNDRDILDDNLRLREFLKHYLEVSDNYPRGAHPILFEEAETLNEYLNPCIIKEENINNGMKYLGLTPNSLINKETGRGYKI